MNPFVRNSLVRCMALSSAIILQGWTFTDSSVCYGQNFELRALGAEQIVQLQKKGKQKKKTGDDKIKNVSIAQKKGALEKIGAGITDLAEISMEDGRLQISLPETYQEASNLKNQISRTLSDYGGSSSSSGTNSFECRLESRLITGTISKKGASQIVIRENTSEHRTLFLQESDQEFTIRIYSPGGYHFVFKKLTDGKIFVQEADRNYLFGGTFPSFSSFTIQNSEYVYTRFLPILTRFGIKTPSSPFDATVVEVVGNLLTVTQQQQKQLIERHQKLLNSRLYRDRQQAMKNIKSEGDKNLSTLCCIACDRSQPAEIRFRMLKLVEEFKPKFKKVIENVVLRQELANNVQYLTSLLLILEGKSPISIDNTKRKLFSKNVRNRLEQLASIPRDSKTEVYIDSLKQSLVKISGAQKPIDPKPIFGELGDFDNATGHLSNLILFKRVGNSLQFQKDNWIEKLGGKSPKTHEKELLEEFRKRKIPKSFFNNKAQSYTLSEDSQAMIHFENMRDDLEQKSPSQISRRRSTSYYRYNSRNRHRLDVETKELSGWISMGAATLNIKTSPFYFELKEISGEQRILQVNVIPSEKIVLISLYSEETNALAKFIHSTKTGKVQFQRILGQDIINVEADSFADLMKKHQKDWDESLGGLLKLLKVVETKG